jgi:carboxyl-terminal processing protease
VKRNILWPIYLAFAVVLGILVGMFLDFPGRTPGFGDGDPREEKVKQIINYIDFEYLDAVNTDSLLDLTITNLLRRLDPHSTYIPLDEVARMNEGVEGSFEGIGIEFRLYKDTLTVVRVLEEGPAAKAGLKAGMRILSANDEVLFGPGIQTADVTNRLKGEAGTDVILSAFEPETKSIETLRVARGKVPLKSVQSSFMLNSNTGYLKLIRFAETTGKEVKLALIELRAQGARKLVLDLRDNPGGLLKAAKEVCNQFLENGQLIVFTRDRNGEGDEIYASRQGEFKQGDLVILINEGSASASEIVAGAIQDNDRGLIIGRRSFGKGLVQEEMTLGDGSKIRLTTQRYYTPSGRSIQKPYGEYDRGYLENKGYGAQIPGQDSSSVATQAYQTISGRPVYAGGGIMPDVEIPFDTSRNATLVYHLGLVVDFDQQAFSYVDQNRSTLGRLSREAFMRTFEVDSALLDHFFGERAEYVHQLPPPADTLLRHRMKAYIAYSLYGNIGFQQAFSPSDPAIQEALERLKAGNLLTTEPKEATPKATP